MHRRSLTAWTVGALLCGACEDTSYRDIGGEIAVVTKRDDALVPPAVARLAGFGRRALPQIEIALHTASPTGKIHLVDAIDRIGDPEAAAILRHIAIYDAAPAVRGRSRAALMAWSERPATRETAVRALADIERKTAAGEGPVVFGNR